MMETMEHQLLYAQTRVNMLEKEIQRLLDKQRNWIASEELKYLQRVPQLGEPHDDGYYIVWPDETKRYPIGMVRRVRGPRGGGGSLRWVDPEKHGRCRWEEDRWNWTKL
jgi:hypothetical protein